MILLASNGGSGRMARAGEIFPFRSNNPRKIDQKTPSGCPPASNDLKAYYFIHEFSIVVKDQNILALAN